MSRRKVLNDSAGMLCLLCEDHVETSPHLFCHCQFVVRVWYTQFLILAGCWVCIPIRPLATLFSVYFFGGLGGIGRGKIFRLTSSFREKIS